jgi:predicted transcriptional regulator
MSHVMRKKIGTIIDEGLLSGAKQRAALERRTLSGLIEDALRGYVEQSPGREDSLRALAKFTSHGGLLPPEEIDEILEEDTLAP